MWRVLRLAARAARWRTTRDPPLAGLPVLLGWVLIAAAVRIGLQVLAAGTIHGFNPYGLNAVVAWIAIELAVAALFVRPEGRASALSAMFILSVVAESVAAALRFGLQFTAAATQSAVWGGVIATGTIYVLAVVWWIGAMACVIGSLEWQTRLPLLARGAALWVALFVANAVVPHAPVFLPPDFDARSANWWEVLYALAQERRDETSTPPPKPAQVENAQGPLLQAEIAGLAPQRNGVTDVYVLGIAGWAEQDVFVKELDGAIESLGSVLPVKDRIVRLINNRETIGNVPLANPHNFADAVHGIAQVMDRDEDVLILVMTSHGGRTGFALQMPGNNAELTPNEVAAALDGEGIKNRVVIVSACFSGIFVPPLANDNTIVITAADANNTSFGCAPERDWTYFGDAFFRQSLHPGNDFENAFDHARILIQGWEMMDRAPPSNPQASFGPALVAKLAPYFATNPGQ